jgi:opacity protein-like surface antigen
MKLGLWAGVVVAAAGLCVSSAEAGGLRLGLQGSYGQASEDDGIDAEFGAGARLVVDLAETHQGLGLIVSADYFFPGGDDEEIAGVEIETDYQEGNALLTYSFGGEGISPYVGAGLNVARAKASALGFEESDTEVGFAIAGGLKLSQNLFAEGRYGSAGKQFVVSAGFLF